LKNVVERSLYRWGDADPAVGRIIIDPVESPWRPASQPPVAAAPATPASDPVAEAGALPAPTLPASTRAAVTDFRAAVLACEREILVAALDRCRHNQRRTAAALALSYDQLRHALKRHDLLD
jgi:psp operon transcriptional activator